MITKITITIMIEVKTDQLIPTRRPNQVIIRKNSKTCHTEDFAVLVDHRVKSKKT